MAHDKHPVRPIPGAAVFIAFLNVRRPDPLLVGEHLRLAGRARAGILEDRVLRVRPLLVVIEEALAPEAGDPARMGVDAEAPERDIDVMHAVIPRVARSEMVPPAPDAGE